MTLQSPATLSIDSELPAFQQIKDYLIAQIHNGAWKEGDAIPSEAVLAAPGLPGAAQGLSEAWLPEEAGPREAPWLRVAQLWAARAQPQPSPPLQPAPGTKNAAPLVERLPLRASRVFRFGLGAGQWQQQPLPAGGPGASSRARKSPPKCFKECDASAPMAKQGPDRFLPSAANAASLP